MPTNESSVLLEVTFNSPIEKIWAAWTNPTVIMTWFGSDPKGRVLKAELDVRPGGYFEITFQDSDLTQHTCFGIYEEVQPITRLSFSWQWKNEPGVESFITVLLMSEDKFTRMQFEHKNFGGASKHEYTRGWQNTFSKLESVLSGQKE